MYSGIERKHYFNLVLRVIMGICLLVCIYTSVKYLPLVYVALVSNLGPLLTVVLSFLFLKKGLGIFDSVVLIVSFVGVCILITGTISQDSKEENPSNT